MFVCPVPKISQVMMRCAAEFHIAVDLLCGTTAADLHNSVDLLCGTTAAELNNAVSLMHAPAGAHIFKRQF